MKHEIKKCSCGGKASLYESEWGESAFIRCHKCYYELRANCDFAREKVIKDWLERWRAEDD